MFLLCSCKEEDEEELDEVSLSYSDSDDDDDEEEFDDTASFATSIAELTSGMLLYSTSSSSSSSSLIPSPLLFRDQYQAATGGPVGEGTAELAVPPLPV